MFEYKYTMGSLTATMEELKEVISLDYLPSKTWRLTAPHAERAATRGSWTEKKLHEMWMNE